MTRSLDTLLSALLDEPGRPLPVGVRGVAERRLGIELARVRVHDGAAAARAAALLDAEAFTIGRHIVLRRPLALPRDEPLLMHEIAHAVQQGLADPGGATTEVDPDPALEVEACAFAAGALQCVERRSVPPSIQRHPGPPCPLPPLWLEVTSAAPREIWLPANQAIEAAYLAEHPGNVVLFGSQFEGWRDIQLPRGVPDRGALDAFLGQLRGISQQRAPDIVDLTLRSFYEIKTLRYAAEGLQQLQSLYRLADAIERQHGGGNWNPMLATWYPPHVLPFPGNPAMRVCTAATQHTGPQTGLILYRVFRRTTQDEERELRQRMVVIEELNFELESMRDRLHSELARISAMTPSGTPLWIIASPEFFRHFVFIPQQLRMERTLDMMRVHGLDPRRNPVMGFRNLGWTIIGISAAAYAVTGLVVLTGGLVLEAGAVTAAGVGAGAGAAGAAEAAAGVAGVSAVGGTALTVEQATVISLSAYRAARTAQASVQLARAAGVLLVVSTVNTSTAHAQGQLPRTTVTDTTTVRAIPATEFEPRVQYEMGREVVYGGEPYRIIGRARVP